MPCSLMLCHCLKPECSATYPAVSNAPFSDSAGRLTPVVWPAQFIASERGCLCVTVLAEDAIKAALTDYKVKQSSMSDSQAD